MQRWTHYRFRSVWDLDAPPALVYSLLEDAGRYPDWWPQVRRVEQIDEHTGTALIRSVLPYGIHVTLTGLLSDPARGVLEAALRGDIEGWARWTVRPAGAAGGGRTRAVYEQEVEVRAALLRRFALAGRPLFRLNHALMMRAGRRGLEARLTAPPEAV
ncbi:SRPBCC family protein [Streptomyces sp. NBC_00091]|uniref:SRPBCC family protein n=1 Tax=Streptomyces sp. NBC_00091 TaxID=2975648 RepID=UPI00224F199F|nr:SRPBCC family protein [Streptomyces sp. NBC_00091]MCX5379388.1 SRPBCC family protein [Streptomyces sp. NBC_00091]